MQLSNFCLPLSLRDKKVRLPISLKGYKIFVAFLHFSAIIIYIVTKLT